MVEIPDNKGVTGGARLLRRRQAISNRRRRDSLLWTRGRTPPPRRMQGKFTQGDRQELREKGLNYLSEVASNSFRSRGTEGDW